MTWAAAAVAIVCTTPFVYWGVRFSLPDGWGALVALVVEAAWVWLLLAVMLGLDKP
jgi:hypothetical protein